MEESHLRHVSRFATLKTPITKITQLYSASLKRKIFNIIDFKIMVKTELNNTLTNDEMEKTITSYQTMIKLEQDIDRCKETIELIQEAATVEISKDPENKRE